jgi:hypothetical protein
MWTLWAAVAAFLLDVLAAGYVLAWTRSLL